MKKQSTDERLQTLRRDGRRSQKTFNSKPKDTFKVKTDYQLWAPPGRKK